MAHVLLKTRSGAAITPIDFKGSAKSISVVLSERVEYMVDTIVSLQSQVLGG